MKIYSKITYLFILFFVFPTVIYSQWTAVGYSCISTANNATAADVDLAFDNNTPYIVYRDYAYGQKATVKKYNGTSWVNVGNPGFTNSAAIYPSIQIHAGIPYVAYFDITNGNKATVMKFDGTNWVNVGNPGFSAGSAIDISISINNGTLYVVYPDGGNSGKITVMKFDGNNWINVGSAGFSAAQVGYTSIAFNDSIPYVAYRDAANNNKATVMKFDGNNWINVGTPGFSAGQADFTSIAFNDTIPYVAYTDVAYNNKATVKKFDGVNWVNVGSPGFTYGQIDNIHLAINNSIPYVAYRDLFNCGHPSGKRGSALKYDGTNWVNVGNSCFTHTSVNITSEITSLVFNNNEPYVAFWDTGCGVNTKVTVMKFQCNTTTNISQAVCDNYTFNNQTYTTTGIYTQILPNAAGCDSTITLNLTITNIDSTVIQNNNVFTANQNNATYQWIDCNNGFNIISGSISQSYTATTNGNYAVIITQNGCSDTSTCYNLTSVGLSENSAITTTIYPNPSTGLFTIESEKIISTIEIVNMLGEKIYSSQLNSEKATIDLSKKTKGIYFLSMMSEGKVMAVKKLIVTH